jgi:hypothetical protein
MVRALGWSSACGLVILFALQASASSAELKIGNATATRNKVEGVVGGNTQPLSKGSEVFSEETVRTGPDAAADLQFVDQSKLNVGPTSEIRLDKFVFDPAGSSGSVVIEATRGAFRFVTGTQDKKVYQVKTPFGTLGIRG